LYAKEKRITKIKAFSPIETKDRIGREDAHAHYESYAKGKIHENTSSPNSLRRR
jgi:hypothetical protein